MSARNVNLTEHLSVFVDNQVQNGRHQNASEVVREALRRYEDDIVAERERLYTLRTIIREGREAIARGEFTTIATTEDAELLLAQLTRRETRAGATDPG
jgi:antitoxin ParD1/3/4